MCCHVWQLLEFDSEEAYEEANAYLNGSTGGNGSSKAHVCQMWDSAPGAAHGWCAMRMIMGLSAGAVWGVTHDVLYYMHAVVPCMMVNVAALCVFCRG